MTSIHQLFNRLSTRLFAAALAVVTLTTVAPAQDEDPSILRAYYSGNGLLNRGMYELAIDEYREFLDRHGDHEKAPVARYGMGVSMYRLGQHAEAAEALTPLVDDDAFEYAAESSMIVARCHLATGSLAGAIENAQRVLRQHTEHELADDAAALLAEGLYRAAAYGDVAGPVDLLVNRWPESGLRERAELFRAMADMAQGHYAEAVTHLQQMQSRFSDGQHADQVRLLLAQSLHRSQSLEGAVSAYRQVITDGVRAYVPDAQYGLAAILHRQGQLDRAGELLDNLLKNNPGHKLGAATTLLRGRVWFDNDEHDKAARAFATLAEFETEYQDDATYWLAKCELRDDEPADAAQRLERALKDHPDSILRPEMMYDLGVARLRSDQLEESIAAFRAFRETYPEHGLASDALHVMAAASHQLGSYDQSLALCHQFLTAYPSHDHAGTVAFLASENEFLSARYERAAEAYATFLNAYDDHDRADHARYRLGMTLYHLDRFDDAEPLLTEIAAKLGDDPAYRAAHLTLGDGYFQQGDWAASEPHLVRYLAGDDEPSAADDATLKLGLCRQRQGNLDGAVESFTHLLKTWRKSPHVVQATFERGQALVGLGQDANAVKDFKSVVSRDKDSRFATYAQNHLGVIALRDGAYDDAADYFNKVANGNEPSLVASALLRRSQALTTGGELEAAETTLRTLLDDHAETEHARTGIAQLSIVQARLGDHEMALTTMTQVQPESLDSTLAASMAYEKAWCLRHLERPDDATRAYREVLALPESGHLRPHAMIELAELEINAARYPSAVALLTELEHLVNSDDAPNETRALAEQTTYRLGLCAYRMEQHQAAAERFASFVDAFPQSDLAASASLLAGESSYRIGAHQKAIDHLTYVVDKHQRSEHYGPALLRLAESLSTLQRWKASQDRYQAFLKHDPASPVWFQAQFGAAWAMENQGRLDEAINTYRAVVDRHQGPTAARAQFQIGECLFAQKKHDEAVRELLKVDILYAYPEWSAAALYEAGRCFQALGDPVEARKQFEKVTTEHATTEWAALAKQQLSRTPSDSLPGRGDN